MPTRRTTFSTIRTEGAILPADLLQRIADGDASLGGLTLEAYHLAVGEKINEAVNRAWNRCLGAWATFQSAAARLAENDLGTSITPECWLDYLKIKVVIDGKKATVSCRLPISPRTFDLSTIYGILPTNQAAE